MTDQAMHTPEEGRDELVERYFEAAVEVVLWDQVFKREVAGRSCVPWCPS